MGYKLTKNYCDLAELKKGGIATISAIFGSSSFDTEKAIGERLVDLKLGRLGDIGKGLVNNFKGHSHSIMDPFSPTAGSSKRPRTPGTSTQVVSCLVDGCKADLSKCRDYHRRHKVCEMHSKTPRVTIGGNEQRFCQQCSRFHSLGEFDEGKRSCRKRLEGHNRRRRKPQPEPLPVNHGNFFSASQGSRFLAFSNQPIIPATSVMSTAWSTVKSESSPTLYNSATPSSYSPAYRGRQFPFLQVPESPLTGVSSAGQTVHHDPNNGGGSSSNNNHNTNNQKILFCNSLNQVIDSDRALSLLSSNAETPEMGLGRTFHHPSPINPTRPMLSSLHFNSVPSQYSGSSQGHGMEGHPTGSGLFSDLRSSNSLCQDVFQNDTGASSTSGGHQTLSFSWE
ncbi:squamosa promoter-binding-like protein 13A [Chenopodium quinoa]|uniref:squamosa promoter-binding-like protein 13A n=1 Tax=Chenopodium quinoa TaxID=63459 RepID=UPI000B77DBBB|nr:squamosa promoter-binding-like protein 13A [Chenopodium quinoa]XP_021723075.1 squamosa promoter-binding-like protein 13A [Chenopodium quinoa]XP_021723076.1 squamosa promoter-binding-like protein 13A [Chenopodium quinoa]